MNQIVNLKKGKFIKSVDKAVDSMFNITISVGNIALLIGWAVFFPMFFYTFVVKLIELLQ